MQTIRHILPVYIPNVDVGDYSARCYDWNSDGKKDLIIAPEQHSFSRFHMLIFLRYRSIVTILSIHLKFSLVRRLSAIDAIAALMALIHGSGLNNDAIMITCRNTDVMFILQEYK